MADDAKLLAVIDANTKAFENALKRVETQTNKTFNNADRSVKRLNNSLSAGAASAARFGRSLGIAFSGAAAIALAARTIRAFIDNTIESENAIAQLNAGLASTGGAVGKSAQELQELAAQLQKVTVFGDEAIIGVENILLTFTKIQGDVFPKATQAVLDLATRMGGDLAGAAKLVGKAFNDPIKGVTALTRAGVQFNESQKTILENFIKTGDIASAQLLIYRELQTQMGGSARAARDTLGGALKALGEAWGDLFEVSGPASDQLRTGIEQMITAISDPRFKEGVETIGIGLVGALAKMVDVLLQLSSAVDTVANSRLGELIGQLIALQGILNRFAPALNPLGALSNSVEALNKVATVTLGPVEAKVEEAEALGRRLDAAFDVAEHPETGDFEGRGFGFAGPAADAVDELSESEEELAARLEAEAEAQREAERARKAAADELVRQKEAVLELISDLEFEKSLIGLSNEQREIEIALRRAGAAATEEQRKEIAGLVASGLAEQKALDDLIDRMDEIRNAAGGALSAFNDALRNGEGLAGGLKSALESVLDTVIRIAEQRAIESLFGAFGTQGGGGLGSILGGIIPNLLGGGGGAASLGVTPRFASQNVSSLARLASGSAVGGGGAVQIAIEEGPMFRPVILQTAGAVSAQIVRRNNRTIPSLVAEQRARGV